MSIGWIVVIFLVVVAFATAKAWKRGGRESFRAAYNSEKSQGRNALKASRAVRRLEEHRNDEDLLRLVTLESLYEVGLLPTVTRNELTLANYPDILERMSRLAG